MTKTAKDQCTNKHISEASLNELIQMLASASLSRLSLVRETFEEGNICSADFKSVIANYGCAMLCYILSMLENTGMDKIETYEMLIKMIAMKSKINVAVVSGDEINHYDRKHPEDKVSFH